jgi:hypothetical protein
VSSKRTEARRAALRRNIAEHTRAQLAGRARSETVEARIDERIAEAGGWDGIRPKVCVECGDPFKAKRYDARFCSPRCQQRARRREQSEGR